MQQSHIEMPVSSLTMNDKGYKEMDEKWANVADGTEASFRWIHLPANNIEWTRHAIGQNLSHYLIPEDDDDPVSIMISPSALEAQFLRSELWESSRTLGARVTPCEIYAAFLSQYRCQRDAAAEQAWPRAELA
jgi:hypothetical protein